MCHIERSKTLLAMHAHKQIGSGIERLVGIIRTIPWNSIEPPNGRLENAIGNIQ